MADVTEQLAQLGGLATLAQLRAHGVSDDAVQRAVGAHVTRVRRGIYASPDASADLVRAARVGGSLAAASAAPHHHLWQPPPRRRLDVSVRPEARALLHPDTGHTLAATAPVRLIRDRHKHDRRTERWVVSPARCLAQCVRLEPQEHAVAMIDSALRAARDTKGRVLREAHPATLLAEVRALLPRHLWGTIEHADARPDAGSESVARVRFGRAGIVAVPQVPVARGIRVDLLIGDRLVVEVGSFLHHGSAEAYEKDHERVAALVQLGFVVLDFTYQQVMFDWETVLATTRAVMSEGAHVGRRRAW